MAGGNVLVDLTVHGGPVEAGSDERAGASGAGVASTVVEGGDDVGCQGGGDERDRTVELCLGIGCLATIQDIVLYEETVDVTAVNKWADFAGQPRGLA